MADPRDEDVERQERLIAALETQANAINRLVQVLEGTAEKRRSGGRARSVPVRKAPITVTPLMEAYVDRALARVSRR